MLALKCLKFFSVGSLSIVFIFGQFIYQTQSVQAASLDKAMITITFDDGYKSLKTYALPSLKKYNFPATCYITTDYVGDGSHVTWSQLKSFRNTYKWEIGNHTVNHPHLPELTDAEILSEIVDSENAFTSHGLKDVAAFAPPFGEFDDRVVGILKNQGYLTSNREAWKEETAFNTVDSFNPWSLNVLSLESDTMNYTKAKKQIDQAVSGKKWLIFVLHDLVSGTPDNPYQFKSSEFEKIVNYLGTLSKNNKLQIVTTSVGVAKMKSLSK